jgi:hypothetical protein
MTVSPLAFMEFFVVLAFAIGWAVLELVVRRLEKHRDEPPKSGEDEIWRRRQAELGESRAASRHAERKHRPHHRVGNAVKRKAFVHPEARVAEQARADQ